MQRSNGYNRTLSLLLLKRLLFITDRSTWWPFWGEGPFHLCKMGEVGCQIYETKIPIDSKTYKTSMDFNINPTVSALNGGEDYELLFTISQKDYEKIKNNPKLTIIGHITNKDQGPLITLLLRKLKISDSV